MTELSTPADAPSACTTTVSMTIANRTADELTLIHADPGGSRSHWVAPPCAVLGSGQRMFVDAARAGTAQLVLITYRNNKKQDVTFALHNSHAGGDATASRVAAPYCLSLRVHGRHPNVSAAYDLAPRATEDTATTP